MIKSWIVDAQNWNLSPASISRGFSALVDLPKFGEVITPDGCPRFVRLNAFVMLMKTLTLARGHASTGRSRAEEECLRDVEIVPEKRRTPFAEPLAPWRPIVDLRIVVVVPAGRDGVGAAAVGGDDARQENPQRQPGVHSGVELVDGRGNPAPLRLQVVVVRRERRVAGADVVPASRSRVGRRDVEDAEPMAIGRAGSCCRPRRRRTRRSGCCRASGPAAPSGRGAAR